MLHACYGNLTISCFINILTGWFKIIHQYLHGNHNILYIINPTQYDNGSHERIDGSHDKVERPHDKVEGLHVHTIDCSYNK